MNKALVVTGVLMLLGCEPATDSLEQSGVIVEIQSFKRLLAAEPAARPAIAAPIPALESANSATANSPTRASPFHWQLPNVKTKPTSPNQQLVPVQFKNHQRGELEQWDLEDLVVVGFITWRQQQWGLLQSPRQRVHRVRAGDYLGRNYGRVAAVNSAEIVLVEHVQLAGGGWRSRTRRLTQTNNGIASGLVDVAELAAREAQ